MHVGDKKIRIQILTISQFIVSNFLEEERKKCEMIPPLSLHQFMDENRHFKQY